MLVMAPQHRFINTPNPGQTKYDLVLTEVTAAEGKVGHPAVHHNPPKSGGERRNRSSVTGRVVHSRQQRQQP